MQVRLRSSIGNFKKGKGVIIIAIKKKKSFTCYQSLSFSFAIVEYSVDAEWAFYPSLSPALFFHLPLPASRGYI
jgi:hypothetical protein